jgi:hypothetical protein
MYLIQSNKKWDDHCWITFDRYLSERCQICGAQRYKDSEDRWWYTEWRMDTKGSRPMSCAEVRMKMALK